LLIAAPAMGAPAAKKKVATPAAPAVQRAPAAAGTRKAVIAPATKAKVARASKVAKKQKAAKAKVVPKPDPALIAAYGAMPAADRRALQSDLVWTGDYSGFVSDEFGERLIAAVKSYQARIGAAETGLLSPEQRAALAVAAKAKQEASGWRVVDDSMTGARLAIPIKRVGQSSATASGTHWSSGRGEVQIETFRIAEPGTTLTAVFNRQKKEPANRQVENSVLQDNFFVLSGLQGLKRFYVRAQGKDNEVRGFLIMYDQAMMGIMDPIAVAMASRFEPFPGAAAMPPRRKVEYATGIIVDDLGHVITDRQVGDGCQVITLPGMGSAELLDQAEDLALLRIYGARNLTPMTIASDRWDPSDVKLVGIADPQTQGGASAVTVAAARIAQAETAKRTLEPAPPPGFSGAAALDAQGRLVGMARIRTAAVAGPSNAATPAQLVPIDEIRAFLGHRNIIPTAAGPLSVEAAKAAVVRVICVRK
jgi:hypothetical protein